MPNKMKNTYCLKCGKDLNNVSYDKMIEHIQDHEREKMIKEQNQQQKGIGDFT